MRYERRRFAFLAALAPFCIFGAARGQQGDQVKACALPADDPTTAVSLDSEVYKALTRLESRLDCELSNLTTALNKLPQRLLTEEAKKEIKESLRSDLNKEFQQTLVPLKQNLQDLQKQVDDLKKSSGSR